MICSVLLSFTRCHLPVCNEICEAGELHKLECGVFTAVVNYNNTCDTRDKNVEGSSVIDDTGKINEAEELLKTFQISKYDSPSPVYTCITPLRMLLRCRQDMTRETMKLQSGENTKDEIDVSKTTITKTKNKTRNKHNNSRQK